MEPINHIELIFKSIAILLLCVGLFFSLIKGQLMWGIAFAAWLAFEIAKFAPLILTVIKEITT
jgi:hypothetical protein